MKCEFSKSEGSKKDSIDINSTRLPRLAIFGAGGLGIEMLSLLKKRPAASLVGILDKNGYIFEDSGVELSELIERLNETKDITSVEGSVKCSDSIREFLREHSTEIDAIFLALPNLPNTFMYDVTKYIAQESSFNGVIVDALKRTSAVKMLSGLDSSLKASGILYLSGCGATPGMLTTAVSLAAQSFVEILSVKMTFGVGIANWQAYRATIREDIAHMDGYTVESASKLTEQEIDELLDKTNGLIKLEDMEHADDIMLEMAGVCPADRVTVGGIVDTRNPEKPISTNVEITGLTYQGKVSTHKFILGDETSMAVNVNGNVLGFMNAGLYLKNEYNASGLKTAAEVLPRFAPVKIRTESQNKKMAASC